MSWLKNASFLFTDFVLLLGDSSPTLFLTQPGSRVACGLWMGCIVMSMNTQSFNTYLFWGSRSHRPKKETYVMTVCPPPFTVSGSERSSQLNPPHMETENPQTIKSDLNDLRMIHSSNRSSCNSNSIPSVLSTCMYSRLSEGGAEFILLSSDRRHASAFLVFFLAHPLPSSRYYLF